MVAGELHDAIGISPAPRRRASCWSRGRSNTWTGWRARRTGDASLQRELAARAPRWATRRGIRIWRTLATAPARCAAIRSVRDASRRSPRLPCGPRGTTGCGGRSHAHRRHAVGRRAYPDALPRYRESRWRSPSVCRRTRRRRLDDRFNVTRSLNRMGQTADERRRPSRRVELYQQSKALTADLSAPLRAMSPTAAAFAVAALKSVTLPIALTRLPQRLQRLRRRGAHAAVVAREPGQRRSAPDVRARARPPGDRLSLGSSAPAMPRPRAARRSTCIARWLPPIPRTSNTALTWLTPTAVSATRSTRRDTCRRPPTRFVTHWRFTRTSVDMPPVAGTSRTCYYRWVPCCATPIRLEHWTPIGRPPAALRWSRFAASIRRSSRKATPAFVTRRPTHHGRARAMKP